MLTFFSSSFSFVHLNYYDAIRETTTNDKAVVSFLSGYTDQAFCQSLSVQCYGILRTFSGVLRNLTTIGSMTFLGESRITVVPRKKKGSTTRSSDSDACQTQIARAPHEVLTPPLFEFALAISDLCPTWQFVTLDRYQRCWMVSKYFSTPFPTWIQ